MIIKVSNSYVQFLSGCSSYPYLENGYGGTYYLKTPHSVWEASLNQQTLADLQAKQQQQLRAFFEFNRDVLWDLASALRRWRELDACRLALYLERVSIPDGFPQPNGEFRPFGMLGYDSRAG